MESYINFSIIFKVETKDLYYLWEKYLVTVTIIKKFIISY